MGTNLKCGIVGLPNVGKSTFFNVLTKTSIAAAENFPFCTIDPNEARVPVPDQRFDWLVDHHKPASKVPAFLNVVDIAGLVKGANEGQGLGNAFLGHIRACDAMFHLCRTFEDAEITHVEGEVDPIRDLEILNKHLFITAKSMIYLVNLSEKDFLRKKNKWLPKIKEYIDKNDPGATCIPFSGTFEQKLMDMETDEERAAYCEETKCTSILEKIIVQGYKGLQLQYFFTAGEDEVKAWTIQKGSTAPKAAGRIHTDFEKGFIMADVMKFTDFKEHGSEAGVKAVGGYRQQGKNYIVDDGDIIFFKFNAGAGLTKGKDAA